MGDSGATDVDSQPEKETTTNNDAVRRVPNGGLIALIAALAGFTTLVLSSDLKNGLRYSLGSVGVLALLACVYMLSRNTFRS